MKIYDNRLLVIDFPNLVALLLLNPLVLLLPLPRLFYFDNDSYIKEKDTFDVFESNIRTFRLFIELVH